MLSSFTNAILKGHVGRNQKSWIPRLHNISQDILVCTLCPTQYAA